MADFNKPTITGDAYVDVLGEIRAQFEVVSTMSYGNAQNPKVGAIQYLDGSLQKWDGASFNVVPVSITGGGTGASTAAGARAALGVNQTGTGSGQVRTNAQSDALYVPQARTISTSGALNGGGTLDSNISLTIDDATTGQKGAVQLYNGLNSTSTSLALTAAQGKVLKDLFDSYFQVLDVSAPSGELISGDMRISRCGNQVTISNQSSGEGFTHGKISIAQSADGFIPTALRPIQPVYNAYYNYTGDKRMLAAFPSGKISFYYSDENGNSVTRPSTSGFTISYTV